jgi:hypothetical protein
MGENFEAGIDTCPASICVYHSNAIVCSNKLLDRRISAFERCSLPGF